MATCASKNVLDGQLHRYLRTARLFDDANILYSNPLPELLDVRLMAMSPQAFTLTGFERADGVEDAKSWLVSDRRDLESKPKDQQVAGL